MSLRRYLWACIIGVAITALASFAVHYLRETRFWYLNALFNDRGPLQYVIWFIGISVVSSLIIAHSKKDYRKRLIIAFLVFSLFPLLPGILSFTIGLHEVGAYYRSEMAKNPTTARITEIEREVSTGYAVCSDCLLISGGWAIMGIVLTAGLWVRSGEKTKILTEQGHCA